MRRDAGPLQRAAEVHETEGRGGGEVGAGDTARGAEGGLGVVGMDGGGSAVGADGMLLLVVGRGGVDACIGTLLLRATARRMLLRLVRGELKRTCPEAAG